MKLKLAPRDWTLGTKLALSVTALMAAVAVFLILFFPSRMERFSRRWLERRAVSMANVLANAIAPGLDLDDDVDVKHELLGFAQSGDALYAVVWRGDAGATVATWNVPDVISAWHGAASKPILTYGDEQLRVDAPIRGKGGARGTLTLGFSLGELERERHEQQAIVGWVALVVFVIGMAVSLVIGSFLMRPILRVTQVARKISQGADASSADLPLGRGDEVGEMALAIDHMLKRLDDNRKELLVAGRKAMEASRSAGMADVATTVLHNVGNVLNSVNVSASVVSDMVRSSKALGIGKVAELFAQHKGALGSFVSDDPRGQKIPEYLTKLATAVEGERSRMSEELTSLTKNIDHIKAIVSLQQSHAKTGGVVERLSISDLLDDALKFNFAARERSGIDLVRDYGAPGEIEIDRHKLFQVVMNLLSNAQHALRDGDKTFKQIVLRTRQMPNAMLAIEIQDNGIGIPAENLDRIFQHGFTTKPDGHGFGLHSAACAIAELKGSLAVRSDGPGRGAAFTILLPDSSARAAAAMCA